MNTDHLPLTGVRVLEISTGKADMCTRILADLGAEVVLIEPPSGSPARVRAPFFEDQSLYFATHNANKRSVVCDLDSKVGREQFLQLISATDIFIEATRPGTLEPLGLGSATLHQYNPKLVMMSITDFGQTGPYRDFIASNNVQLAMAGVLCRSGLAGQDPLLPPGEMAWECSAVQAAWVVMLAYWQQQMIGVGDRIDFSLFEATAQILDPIMGVTGSAAAGKSATQLANSRGRPSAGYLYPIFRCTDGFVRLCILNPRQWQGMSEWLGNDHDFTDPTYNNLAKRMQIMGDIVALINKKFSPLQSLDVVQEAQQRGIPCALLASPQNALNDAHFQARKAWTQIKLNNSTGFAPSRNIEINGPHEPQYQSAPKLGEHTERVLQQWTARKHQGSYSKGTQHRPLTGIRVLDLGVIVAGAELGRLLADQGAEVIKVENRAFPDGGRQSSTKELVSISFSQGHRGKESLGLNLRSAKGIELFKQLAAKSDIVLSNFKPGTITSLGIDYETLREINPRIIMADSSALGNSGPLSRSMGYGPLVRASTGLTGLWRYTSEENDSSFSDGITILPDHLAARVSAIGVMALLHRRQISGVGGTVSVSQAECILNLLATDYLRESLVSGSLKPRGNHSEFNMPDGVFACAGDDQWCVISVSSNQQWQHLCEIMTCEKLSHYRLNERLAHRDEIIAHVRQWCEQHSPDAITKTLQAKGISAGPMLRLTELDQNEHLHARNFIAQQCQPGHDEPFPTENAPALSDNLPNPNIRPAPLQGQHTHEVMARVLEMEKNTIEALIASGDLEI